MNKEYNVYSALNAWFLTAQGLKISQAFTHELNQVALRIGGDNLIQLGNCGANPWLDELKFRRKWIITPNFISKNTSLSASLIKLPLASASIDCILAPFSMEAFLCDKNLINEIDRILKTRAYVIFLGINPCSFWGVAMRWLHFPCFGYNDAALIASSALKRKFLAYGYSQYSLTNFYHILPVNNDYLVCKLAFLNEMAKMMWLFPAGFYCLILQKYQNNTATLLAGDEFDFNAKVCFGSE